jgi:hypothetical protein
MKSVFTKLRGEKQEGNTLRDVAILLLPKLQSLTQYSKFVFRDFCVKNFRSPINRRFFASKITEILKFGFIYRNLFA